MNDDVSAQDKLAELDRLASNLADRLSRLSDSEIETSAQIDSFCDQMRSIVNQAKEYFLQSLSVKGEKVELTAVEKEHLGKLENFEQMIAILNEELDATSNAGEVIAKFKTISISFKKLCSSLEIVESTRQGQIQRYNTEVIKILERKLNTFEPGSLLAQALTLFKKKSGDGREVFNDLIGICQRLNDSDFPQAINLKELVDNLKKPSLVIDPSSHKFFSKDQKARFQATNFSEMLEEAETLYQALPEAIRKPIKIKPEPTIRP